MYRTAVLALFLLLPAVSAGAQVLPTTPIEAFDGRLVVGGDVVVTLGAEDETAFFNYTDYEHNTLRLLRLGLAASWRPASRIAVVGEIRSENFDLIRPYAAYVRIRPFNGHAFDVQIGRIPPSFGAFGRRGYNADQPLIGYPLAYQYLTSLRPDAVPAVVGDLLVMRGRGWLASYPVGSNEPAPGVPLISAFRWDTGIQAHWAGRMVDVTGSITSGTLSDPRVNDNNRGKQLSGRVAVHPAVGLVFGGSAARGEFLSQSVTNLLADPTSSHGQTSVGADVEYSRDYWILRSELVWSRWNMPFAATGTSADLDAVGVWVEGRYRATPRITVAGRLDHLGFDRIAAASGAMVTWDAPVWRVEGDVGYYFRRNLVGRLAVQYNDRDGGRVRTRTFVSGQIAYWF